MRRTAKSQEYEDLDINVALKALKGIRSAPTLEEVLNAVKGIQADAAFIRAKLDDMELSFEVPLTKKEFTAILRCLHPDNSASPEVRAEAFKLLKQKEHILCS